MRFLVARSLAVFARHFRAGRADRLRRDACAAPATSGSSRRCSSPRSRSFAYRSSPSASCRSPCWSARCRATSNLSRRLELVVARAAGMSAWQFIAPALVIAFLVGVVATALYNPISATLHEQSKRLEAEIFGGDAPFRSRPAPASGCASAATTANHHQCHGEPRTGRAAGRRHASFAFDDAGHFRERIEAKSATLRSRLLAARRGRVLSPAARRRSIATATGSRPT